MFDAGALIFKLQTIGAQIFERDQASAEKAVEKTGKAAQTSAGQVDKLGTSTDETGKKSKAAKAPLEDQAKTTKKVGDESEQASKKQDKQKHSTEAQIAAAKDLSRTMTLAGAAVAAAITLSVVKSAEFDTAMSNVRAATMATASEQEALGEAALEAGADTAYSASEAAAAEEELAKAGQTVSEIVGGSLNASLALAAAGQLQVARSAEIMATAMTQYKIPAEQAAHVSDVLAAGAGKAQGSVDDLALALTYVGPLAASAGWSIDETSGALAYFASQGILGEKAGTSLRGVLAALQAPSTVAAKVMDQYGLSIYDANGNMLSAAQIAGNLQKTFGHLTQEERNAAMGRIFGNESLVAANLLYAGGAEKVAEWTDAVDDSGYAARQAAMRQDNLAGDIEKLGGAFDTALIKTGSNANDVLRAMVQALAGLVDMYGEAPEPIQATAMVLGVAAAAMLLFGGGALGARAKFIELKATLDATNATMGRTALVGAGVGLALTGVITVVGILMAEHARAEEQAQAYADALEQGEDAARKVAAEAATAEKSFLWLSRGSAADAAETLGLSLDLVGDAATGVPEALEKVNKAIDTAYADAYYQSMKDVTEEQSRAGEAAGVLRGFIDEQTAAYENGTKKLEQRNEMTDESVEVSQSAAEAYMAEAGSVEELNQSLSDLIEQINEANGVNQDAITANADYQQTLTDVGGQIDAIAAGTEEYGRGLSLTTQAGRDNTAMLQDLAKDSQDAAAAQFQLDGNTKLYIGRLREGRQALIDSAIAMGATQAEAQELANKIYAIPSEKEIDIVANTVSAQQRIQLLRDTLASIPGFRRVTLETVTYGNRIVSPAGFENADGIVIESYANGGVRENHVAQMARAGAYRVWAEPETGGETYIPHASSKRTRSEQLMAETASILGGTYIPSEAHGFADGGIVGMTVGTAHARVGDGRVIALLERIAANLARPNVSLSGSIEPEWLGAIRELRDQEGTGGIG